ncbi:MAG: 4-hydroxy-3-methylbut-2-enyl diphosphate reductase [Acholeplasmataceae bacterium]
MKVIDLRPRGYCHGVLNALAIVKKVVKDSNYPRPIYVLGQIVHNQKITEAFQAYSVISLNQKDKTRLEMLNDIKEGTVIFTAHGVSDNVIAAAKKKKLTTLNATCRDVLTVHKAIKQKLAEGYKILYIGHNNHPEPEAILDIDPSIIFLKNTQDVEDLPNSLNEKKLFVTNQTTLSMYDINPILKALSNRFEYVFDNEICQATTLRQTAVIKQEKVDLMLVIGDKKSSNSNKLVAVGALQSINSHLIGGIEDINLDWLKNIDSVSVTSGASTPTTVTEEVIAFLRQYKQNDPNTWDTKSKLTPIDIL